MSLRPYIALALFTACTARPFDAGAGSGTTDTGSGTSSAVSSATTATSDPTPPGPTTGTSTTALPPVTTEADSTSSSTTMSFIMMPDGGTGLKECDQWIEDCPEGQKCAPLSLDGDNGWESLKCVDIAPNPGSAGDPCTAGPIDTGEDTCAEHHMCWYLDFETSTGICVAMCVGSTSRPSCADPDAAGCFIDGGGILTLCFPECDPLAQECPHDWACILFDMFFNCSPYSGGEGQVFAPCNSPYECNPGMDCVEPELGVECDPMALGCCLPFCDIDEPNTCPGQGQECVAWYADPADAASFNTDLGLCRLPMP